MWVDELNGTYWRRHGQWWEVRGLNDQWTRATPMAPLRHMDTVEHAPPVATIPTPEGGETIVELPPNIFIELKGDKGDSAYQVAVKNGFVGTEEEWLASLEGEPGSPGPGSPFVIMTQAQYDALPVKDPNTLYVVSL